MAAPTVTVRIQGFSLIEKKLAALPTKVARKVASQAMRAGAKVIEGEAERLAPVGESYQRKGKTHRGGSLRRSIKVRMAKKRKRGEIKFTVTTSSKDNIFTGEQFYGGFQEMGYRVGKRSGEVQRLQKGIVKAGRSGNSGIAELLSQQLDALDRRRRIPGKFFMRRAFQNRGRMAVDVVSRNMVAGIMREATLP